MKKIIAALLILLCVNSFSDILTLEMENDIFNNADQFYTHGTKFSYFRNIPFAQNQLLDLLFKENKTRNIGLAVGQNIYTPSDITIPTLITNDRPYAGWLYAGPIFKSIGSNDVSSIELDIGVVGPHSYAEEVQTWVHEHVGSPIPMGWSNQLSDEIGINASYNQKWKIDTSEWGDFGTQLNPAISLSAGNIYTHAGAGAEFRIGYNLPNDLFIPDPITPTVMKAYADEFFLFFSTAANGRYVARNIFLDGNTFVESHHVDKESFVGDLKFGIAAGIKVVRIEFMHFIRSREFKVQEKDYVEFDSIGVSIVF